MADNSVSQLITLIVSLSIAVMIGGVVLQSVDSISGSIEEKGSDLSRQINTDIEIINDPKYVTENTGTDNVVVIYVKNTGSTTLENEKKILDVFIDGEYLSIENITSLEVKGDGEWTPSGTMKIETTYSESYLGPGDHKVRVVIYNNKDSLNFVL